MKKNAPHHSHPEIIKRLRRAHGHLNTTVTMIENGRACEEVAQQLYAIEKAISNAKKLLIHDHIDHCLKQSVTTTAKNTTKIIEEFKNITQYL